MGLLNWVGGKVANKLMDEADKELSILRHVMGTDLRMWTRFVEFLARIRDSVPELSLIFSGEEGNEAARITQEIRRIPERRRHAIATGLLQIAHRHAQTEPIGAAAYKMVGTWMKLVDVLEDPNGSQQTTFRANNLIALYEAELNKIIRHMKEN